VKTGDQVWLAKNVIRRGVQEVTVWDVVTSFGERFVFVEGGGGPYRPDLDVFATREAALARAAVLIDHRQKSLERSIRSIEKLREQLFAGQVASRAEKP
jgi:hypothetical protein